MRWSPEDGEGGLRRVLLPRPLVRRKATIKSTEAMRYSSLKKPEKTPKAKRRYLIKKQRKSADCKSNKPTPHGSVLDAAASSYLPRGTYADCKSKDKGPGTSPGENNKNREKSSRSAVSSYNSQLPTVRGNGITSRMFDTPVRYITQRSKPSPKPA